MTPNPAALLADPEWLAHRHVESSDAIRFIRVSRSEHRTVPFLTDEYLGQDRAIADVPIATCLAQPVAGDPHFLFHSAFCGSTLLLSALDHPGVAMGLSEPVLLNDVVGLRRRGAPGAAVARLADTATRLLARPFSPGEQVVIKPSNIINPLAKLLMTLRPGGRAILLYAPLEVFLISVVRKGLWCRLWVRELIEGFLADGVVRLGMTPQDLFRQSDLQIAATGWLVQQRIFLDLIVHFPGGRIRTLDSETLTGNAPAVIAAAMAHYGLDPDTNSAKAMQQNAAFSRHSKSGAAFTAEQRQKEYAQARAAHDDEIGKVVVWAEAVAAANGVAMTLPDALTG